MEVTLNSTEAAPAAAAAQAPKAPGIVYVTAKDGRKFGLKKLKPSGRFLLAEAVNTTNPSTEMQAIVVATVFSIDDEAFTPVESKADLLKRLDDVGDDGLSAITPAILEMYGVGLTEKDVAAAKNS
jgi:hypothetical protein